MWGRASALLTRSSARRSGVMPGGAGRALRASGLPLSYLKWMSERGARLARREERAYIGNIRATSNDARRDAPPDRRSRYDKDRPLCSQALEKVRLARAAAIHEAERAIEA